MPDAVRNLLAVNSIGCVKQPHTVRAAGLWLDLYRINSARRNGRITVIGTFRVDNVAEEILVKQMQTLIHWVNGVI